MNKVGILGGTFNPIHMGHLLLAEQAFDEYGLDKVLIMPSGVSYMKRNIDIPSSEIRSEMVNLAIADNLHFEFSDMEISRTGNTYTCETLKELRDQNPDTKYYFIIGADTLFSMESWKNPQDIFKNCHILAAVRNGSKSSELEAKRQELMEKYQAEISLLHAPNIEISSEKIREFVKNKRSIRYFVPALVEAYILEHHLYKEET